jgi:type II secretory pathway pseudopilin PulG
MKNKHSQRETGFTRIDLIALAMLLGVLSLLGAQKIVKGHDAAADAACIDNKRQMMRALHLYASDNADFLPPNPDDSNFTPGFCWITSPAETNPNLSKYFLDPSYNLLAPYLNGSISVFHCPADNSTILVGGAKVPRVRSISMSQAVGTNPRTAGAKTSVDGPWLDGAHSHTANRTFRTYARLADVVNPTPAGLFVFLDERPESINDGGFGCMGTTLNGTGYNWIDWPSIYHDKGAGFGFMDGHGEIHKWANPGTLVTPPTGNNPQIDLAWLAAHVSARIADQP